MRTTISLDEQFARQVHRTANKARGMSVNTFIAETLSDTPKCRETPQQPFHLVTVRGVQARIGIDLDRPRALDAHDDEIRFKLERR